MMSRKHGIRLGGLVSRSVTPATGRMPLMQMCWRACHVKVNATCCRALLLMATALCALLLVLPLRYAVQKEAQLSRYRLLMESLTGTVRAMRSRAMAEQHVIELRIDAVQGVFQLATVEGGARPYEALEQIMWMPDGLHISEAPPSVTAFPTGQFSETMIVVTAPNYRRRFRLLTSQAGLVRLFEETML